MSKFSFSNTGPFQYPTVGTNNDIVCYDSIAPSQDNTYNVGQDGLRFKYIYANECRVRVLISPSEAPRR